MNRRSFLHRAAGAACLGALGGAARAGEGAHWGYEGAGSPAHWGEMSSDYALCGHGHEQSPVNLTHPIDAIEPEPMVDWRPLPLLVRNNGHTIQVDAAGGGAIALDGVRYSLLQYHFHHPSEHTIDGRAFEMEAHFVHKAADGGIAVLGVMITKGEANPALGVIWDLMPDQADPAPRAGGVFDPRRLLPAEHASFRYAGSLTTPPCSEVVQWAVLRQPITASAAQLDRFTRLFPVNARPLQPLNRRKLLLDHS